MSQLVSRKIPTTMNPWICSINNVPYAYPAGTVQLVPEEVASIIDSYNDYNKPPEALEPETYMGGADWNAKENEPGHIKNKPVYEDSEGNQKIRPDALPDGVPYAAQDAEILPLTDFTFYEDMNAFVQTQKISLTAGETYRVIYNGQSYECVCKPAEFNGTPLLALGNLSVIGGENTGEPFSLGLYGDEIAEMTGGIYMGAFALDGAESVAMAVYGDVISKLDNRCLDLDWIPKVNKRVLIPEMTVTSGTEAQNDGSYISQVKFTLGFDIPNGTTIPLVMVVDGVEYVAVGISDMNGIQIICDHARLALVQITENAQFIMAFEPATTYTVSVYDPAGSEYQKIPTIFLPDGAVFWVTGNFDGTTNFDFDHTLEEIGKAMEQGKTVWFRNKDNTVITPCAYCEKDTMAVFERYYETSSGLLGTHRYRLLPDGTVALG